MKASCKINYFSIILIILALSPLYLIADWLFYLVAIVFSIWIFISGLYIPTLITINITDEGIIHKTIWQRQFIPWGNIINIKSNEILKTVNIYTNPKKFHLDVGKNHPKAKELVANVEKHSSDCKIIYIDE